MQSFFKCYIISQGNCLTLIAGRKGFSCVCVSVRSVHYALGLTFDGPCSAVSKTKAGPDGHLMCTAIYCQSAWGKQRAAMLLQLALQRPAFMEITRTHHLETERDRISESVRMSVCVLAL